MAQPILSFGSHKADDLPKATPHLLPCRVHHNGSIEPVQFFWEPNTKGIPSTPTLFQSIPTDTAKDGTTTSYFRGRKLHAKKLVLPCDYRGLVATPPPKRDDTEPDPNQVDLTNESPSGAKQGEMKIQAQFDEMLVWEHEASAEGTADPYVRGMDEWLALADQVCPLCWSGGWGKLTE